METEFLEENPFILYDCELKKNPKYHSFFSPKKSSK